MRGFIVNKSRSGYLLLEIVLALGLAGLLLTVIFQMADGTLSLGKKLIDSGRADAKQEAFLNFFERGFSEMPGNAIIELATAETSQRLLPTMTIQNAPTSFAFDGLPISAQAIILKTVPAPGGAINVVLEYYEEPLLDGEEQLGEDRQEPASTLVLFRDLWRFELQVMDSRTMEWITDWDIKGRLPIQIELNAVFSPDGAEVIHHFWIPPKANPTSLMRGLEQQQGSQTPAQNGGQPSQGGGGNTPAIPTTPGNRNGGRPNPTPNNQRRGGSR